MENEQEDLYIMREEIRYKNTKYKFDYHPFLTIRFKLKINDMKNRLNKNNFYRLLREDINFQSYLKNILNREVTKYNIIVMNDLNKIVQDNEFPINYYLNFAGYGFSIIIEFRGRYTFEILNNIFEEACKK